MKLFVTLMLALLVIGGAAPFFFLKGDDGRPLMSIDEVFGGASSGSSSFGGGSTSTGGSTEMYKWQDENGNWQFSSEPPPPGVVGENIVVTDRANRLDANWAPEPEEPKADGPSPAAAPMSALDAYKDPTAVMDQAKAAAALMEAHNEQLESLNNR